jgi:glycosyltransferase domain-containing protein
MAQFPLISIGIPTYNRAKLLPRAIESALAQDYPNIEVLISDNGSTDDTAMVCADFTRRDPRVRYIRQKENLGATGNFKAALENTSGSFFMWLGDDDWMDPSYLSKCAEVLLEHPDYSAIGGRVHYYADDKFWFEEPPINLQDESAPVRVRKFYRGIKECGIFYGLIRRDCIQQALIERVLGFDWMVSAALACCGKTMTLSQVTLHRATGGATKNLNTTAESLNVPRIFAMNNVTNYSVIAAHVSKQIAWTCPAFSKLGFFEQYKLAVYCWAVIMMRFVVPEIKNTLLTVLGFRLCERVLSKLRRLLFSKPVQ